MPFLLRMSTQHQHYPRPLVRTSMQKSLHCKRQQAYLGISCKDAAYPLYMAEIESLKCKIKAGAAVSTVLARVDKTITHEIYLVISKRFGRFLRAAHLENVVYQLYVFSEKMKRFISINLKLSA